MASCRLDVLFAARSDRKQLDPTFLLLRVYTIYFCLEQATIARDFSVRLSPVALAAGALKQHCLPPSRHTHTRVRVLLVGTIHCRL